MSTRSRSTPTRLTTCTIKTTPSAALTAPSRTTTARTRASKCGRPRCNKGIVASVQVPQRSPSLKVPIHYTGVSRQDLYPCFQLHKNFFASSGVFARYRGHLAWRYMNSWGIVDCSFVSAVFSELVALRLVVRSISRLLHSLLIGLHCAAGGRFPRKLMEFGVPSKNGKGVCGSQVTRVFPCTGNL